MAFDMKKWLDENIVPLTHKTPKTFIYSWLWNGNPPKEILVWLMVGPKEGEEEQLDNKDWAGAAKRMLEEEDFYFDFTREAQLVRLESGKVVNIFGGDGAPLFNPEGAAALRLFKKVGDIQLIIQLGCKFPDGKVAAAATKGFYESFDKPALEVISEFTSPWGMA